ncbi:MAG: sulfatase [Planctomycetota bacterium]
MSKRPNILVICTDQQRADTIHALGNPVIKTPVLDRLCRDGTAFTRAYTPAPICSPARVAMVTGMAPYQHRFTDHDWWHWEPADGPCMQSPHDPSFMTLLNHAGYQSFWVGKVHHHGRGWLFDGVEEFAGGEPNTPATTRRLPRYEDFCQEQGYPPYNRPSLNLGSEYYMVPQTTNAPVEHTQPEWMADQCIDFLNRRDQDRPFLMHCHFPEPHPPITNPMPFGLLYRNVEMQNPHRPADYRSYQSRTNRYQLRYKGRDTAQEDDTGWRTIKAAYYGNISLVDHSIGRILDALGPERDNTLIIFTCDHGEMMGDYGCSGKRCMLEASIRVPMLAVWPGTIPAGATCDTPVSLLDLFPTVLDAAGIDEPTRCNEPASLIAVANAASAAGERLVYSQFSSGWCGQYAVSDGQWKYAWSAPDRKEWLFKLDDGLSDGVNHVANPAAADVLARLKGALLARHDPANDPWSDAVENGHWKLHLVPPETWHDDPTYGALNQDHGAKELQALVDSYPEYAKPVMNLQRGNMHREHGVCGGQAPWNEPWRTEE